MGLLAGQDIQLVGGDSISVTVGQYKEKRDAEDMDIIEEDVKAKSVGSKASAAETPIHLPGTCGRRLLTTYRGCHMRMREIFHEKAPLIAISFS